MSRQHISRLVGALVFTSGLGVSTLAQQTTTGWMMYSDTLGRTLDLTPEQEARIRDWEARYQQELERMGPDGLEPQDREPLRRKRLNELQGILTPEQFDRWKAIDGDTAVRGSGTTGGAPGPEMRLAPDTLDRRVGGEPPEQP
jgi:hypothetical protein